MRTLLITLAVFISCGSFAQDIVVDAWGLNSPADEQLPVLSADGKTIFFTRGHHPQNTGGKADKGDIWMSDFMGADGWSEPQRLPAPLNTRYFNGVLDFNRNRLLVYGNYRSGQAPVPGISVSDVVTWPDKWGTPQPLTIQYFSNSSANNGNALSADGKLMLLSLESYKTLGAEDIYVSFWDAQAGAWGEPQNVGPQINTPMQELTPFLAPDNKTLFFTSNGRGGYGSRDIFVSQRLDDTWTNWTTPKNLGEGINTEGAEMGYRYYPALQLAVYTSTQDSDGYGDIHIIEVTDEEMNQMLEDEIVPVEIAEVVVEEEMEPAAGSDRKLIVSGKIKDLTTGEPVFARSRIKGSAGFEQEHFNDTSFYFSLATNQDYVLQVEAEGYLSKQIDLVSKKNEEMKIDLAVELEKIIVGARVNLKNVLFKRGTSEFLASSYDELNLVAEMMLNNPTMVIELAGHTDNVGNPSLNKRLSQERVDAVINYLVEKGIDSARLSGTGYGGAKPIASNASEATRRLNRRVEFIVVQQ